MRENSSNPPTSALSLIRRVTKRGLEIEITNGDIFLHCDGTPKGQKRMDDFMPAVAHHSSELFAILHECSDSIH